MSTKQGELTMSAMRNRDASDSEIKPTGVEVALRELRETLREVAPDCRFHPSGICETCGTRRPCRGDIIREALEKGTLEAPGEEVARMSDEPKLPPCPFCGGRAVVATSNTTLPCCHVVCGSCGARTVNCVSPDVAINNWTNRPGEEVARMSDEPKPPPRPFCGGCCGCAERKREEAAPPDVWRNTRDALPQRHHGDASGMVPWVRDDGCGWVLRLDPWQDRVFRDQAEFWTTVDDLLRLAPPPARRSEPFEDFMRRDHPDVEVGSWEWEAFFDCWVAAETSIRKGGVAE